MQVGMETKNPKNGHNVVRVYASRLARMCFLQHLCDKGHPVLSTEEKLIEIARSKLQEQLLIRFSVKEILEMRERIELEIKDMAKDRVCQYVEDVSVVESIKESIDKKQLDDLFNLN